LTQVPNCRLGVLPVEGAEVGRLADKPSHVHISRAGRNHACMPCMPERRACACTGRGSHDPCMMMHRWCHYIWL